MQSQIPITPPHTKFQSMVQITNNLCSYVRCILCVFLPPLDVGQRHKDLSVEATRPKQRRVKDVHPVGGSQNHNIRLLCETYDI